MALAVAERFAVEEGKRVLVLATDMTAYADAMKEVGISMERVPANRGYMGICIRNWRAAMKKPVIMMAQVR